MSDNTLLRRLLIDEEGINLKAHLVKNKVTGKSVWHIGIGHNLEIEQTEEELAVLGPYDPDNPEGLEITEEQAYALFDIDVQDAIDDLYPAYTAEDLEALGETRRAVVVGMSFQMGGSVVRKYKKFFAALSRGDWDEAAIEMTVSGIDPSKPSLWAKQTPDRCYEAAEAMKLGYFPKYQESPAQAIGDLGSALAAAGEASDAMPYHSKQVEVDEIAEYLASEVAQGYVLFTIATVTETVLNITQQGVLIVTEYSPDKANTLIKT